MRISGGRLGGRIFSPPADKWPTRPTTDIARQALFNILTNYLHYQEIKVLDLFGGSGAHTYEFISRGCNSVTYVDKFGPCVNFVKKTLEEFGISANVQVIKSDYLNYLKSTLNKFDYVFAGPPYGLKDLDHIPDQILQAKILNPGSSFVVEHNPEHSFKDHANYWKSVSYGQTIFSFFKL